MIARSFTINNSGHPMPRYARDTLFVGIKNQVVALHQKDGSELWRTKLKASDFTPVYENIAMQKKREQAEAAASAG